MICWGSKVKSNKVNNKMRYRFIIFYNNSSNSNKNNNNKNNNNNNRKLESAATLDESIPQFVLGPFRLLLLLLLLCYFSVCFSCCLY